MGTKRITDLSVRSAGVTDDLYFPGDDAIQTFKLSGAQLKSYIAAANVATYTTTATQQLTDAVIFADASSASFALTLANPASLAGKRVTIIKLGTDVTKQVTLTGTIHGLTNIKMSFPKETLVMVSNGTAWYLENWQGFADELFLSGDGATNYGTTDVRTRRFNATPVSSKGDAITFTDVAADGSKFVSKYPGIYELWWYDRKSVTGNYNAFTRNQSDPTISWLTPIADTEVLAGRFLDLGADGIGWTGRLEAADIIRCNDNADYNGSATAKFHMKRVGF